MEGKEGRGKGGGRKARGEKKMIETCLSLALSSVEQ